MSFGSIIREGIGKARIFDRDAAQKLFASMSKPHDLNSEQVRLQAAELSMSYQDLVINHYGSSPDIAAKQADINHEIQGKMNSLEQNDKMLTSSLGLTAEILQGIKGSLVADKNPSVASNKSPSAPTEINIDPSKDAGVDKFS